jgi:hypothetical protein
MKAMHGKHALLTSQLHALRHIFLALFKLYISMLTSLNRHQLYAVYLCTVYIRSYIVFHANF